MAHRDDSMVSRRSAWIAGECGGNHGSGAAGGTGRREHRGGAARGDAGESGGETGWREDGVNGYVWTASTPTTRYFTYGRRTGAMVDAILGAEYAGVLVRDFYAAYAHYPGVKQKCWAHLLRDVHDLGEAHATDAAVQAWAAGVRDGYRRAVAWTRDYPHAGTQAREAARQRFAGELQAVYGPWVEGKAPQRKLSARMAKHLHELFVFVVNPLVPPDNNAAERSLRGCPLGNMVTSRKISGGTRSAAGSAAKMALATLFGTWQVRGVNPLPACRALLLSPHP